MSHYRIPLHSRHACMHAYIQTDIQLTQTDIHTAHTDRQTYSSHRQTYIQLTQIDNK